MDNNLSWILVKPLKDNLSITQYQNDNNIMFPIDFIETIKESNGGSPSLSTFDSSRNEELNFNRLLSFNKDDLDNIFIATQNLNKSEIIPIANDGFGNFIVYLKTDLKVYFYNHEINELEFISDSFTDLLSKLYG